MLKQIIIIALELFLLSGCLDNSGRYSNKSSNKQMIGITELARGKRKPLYNQKYIFLAKKNIIEENFDDTEDLEDGNSEKIHPSFRNRQIYLEMIKRDEEDIQRQKLKNGKENCSDNTEYPSLNRASQKLQEEDTKEDQLQKELSQIKAILNDTKAELAKCNSTIKQNIDNTSSRHIKPENVTNINGQKSDITQRKMVPVKSTLKQKFLSQDDDNTDINR